jgi:hypothetical protein
MPFEILGDLADIETIATGSGIREIARLRNSESTFASLPRPSICTRRAIRSMRISSASERHGYVTRTSRYGRGRWRKRKGNAEVRLGSGEIVRAEVHWYEATGIGKREFKIKRLL